MFASQRILIAEDDQVMRLMLVDLLHYCSANLHVLEASDGQSAYTLYHQHGAQVIITDNQMPRMTGAELVHTLRADGVLTPILLLSSDELTQRDVPLDDRTLFLRKPVGIKQLIATIDYLLDQSV